MFLGLGDNEQLRKDILTGREKSPEAKAVRAGQAQKLKFKEAQKLDSENEGINPLDEPDASNTSSWRPGRRRSPHRRRSERERSKSSDDWKTSVANTIYTK